MKSGTILQPDLHHFESFNLRLERRVPGRYSLTTPASGL